MDARTDIDMKVVGYELDRKRQVAAAARQAKAIRQRSERQRGAVRRIARLVGIWNITGGLALWKKVKGVVMGALLTALLVGAIVATTPWRAVRIASEPLQGTGRFSNGSHQLMGRYSLPHAMVGVPGGSPRHWMMKGSGRPAHQVAGRTRGIAAEL